jgi:branched-chain amino acid aminotransferase
VPDFRKGDLSFGKLHTDHMVTIDYDRQTGWTDPLLQPFANLKLHPFSSSLHYGVQCYEGTKAYKNDRG